MKGIKICSECANYSMKRHCCILGAIKETNPRDPFYDDCPLPDVTAVKCGTWIPIPESEYTGWNPEFAGHDPIGGYQCSVCNHEAVYDCNDEFVLSSYCPNCGAKMAEVSNE